METSTLLTNRPVPNTAEAILSRSYQKERFLFAFVSDMDRKTRLAVDDEVKQLAKQRHKKIVLPYKGAEAEVLIFGEHFFVCVSPASNDAEEISYASVEKAVVKRMYGNAYLQVETKDGTKKLLMRFTYHVTVTAETAARFINQMAKENADLEEELAVVEEAYEKLMCVCPNCGRTLLHAGAACIHCRSKKQLTRQLAKYIKPEAKPLLSVIFSCMLTTAIGLVPPYTTKQIVDDIVPNKNLSALFSMVIFLFACYVVHYTVCAWRSYTLRASGNRIVMRLRNDVYEKAQYLPLRFYDKTPTGSVINRISSDTLVIQMFILNITQNVIVQAMLLVGIVIIMLTMDWQLTLISLIPVPAVVIGARIFRKKSRRFTGVFGGGGRR